MSNDQINELVREIQRLKVTTSRLERRTHQLKNMNQQLVDEIRTLRDISNVRLEDSKDSGLAIESVSTD